MKSPGISARYLYAILPASPALPCLTGMEGLRVEYVAGGDLVLATQPWPRGQDPMNPEFLKDRLLIHHRVVTDLMKASPALLPCSYGNLIRGRLPETQAWIDRWLRQGSGSLQSQLAQVHGQAEYALEIWVEDPEWPTRLARRGAGDPAGPGASGLAYLQQIRYERDGGRWYARWLEERSRWIGGHLSDCTVPFQEERFPFRTGEPVMIFHLLLPRGQVAEILEPLALLEQEDPVVLRTSGPWAPYHFTRLQAETLPQVPGKGWE